MLGPSGTWQARMIVYSGMLRYKNGLARPVGGRTAAGSKKEKRASPSWVYLSHNARENERERERERGRESEREDDGVGRYGMLNNGRSLRKCELPPWASGRE